MKFTGKYFFPAIAIFLMLLTACKKDPPVVPGTGLQIITMKIGSLSLDLNAGATNTNVPVDQPIAVSFSEELDVSTVSKSFFLINGNDTLPVSFSFPDQYKTISATPALDLESLTTYTVILTSGIKSVTGKSFSGLTVSFTTTLPALKIVSLTVGGKNLLQSGRTTDVDRNFSSVIKFNLPVNPATVNASSIVVSTSGMNAQLSFTLTDSNKTISLSSSQPLIHFARYVLTITGNLKGAEGNIFTTFTKEFFTALDTTPKFPIITDDDLLTLVEEQTFKYFWDFGHPASGMARERNTSGDIVTTGGSGFGVMSMIVGIQRNFITRAEGLGRLDKILTFLETCDRFHGVFPHWMNGNTGIVEPFGAFDNGADLVETSYMMQGLLTFRQFLNPFDGYEATLIGRINTLWNAVEWDWFTKDGQENVLFWNWSPDFGFAVNVPVVGWNEALITYFLAASSGTHSISADVYTQGWAGGSGFINGNTYYGYTLPLGAAYGGPLFFSHYSFLGMNPHNLSDAYANYWTQVVNHTEINRAYCIDNPNNYVGYSSQNWGLTASDNQIGYSAHSPTNDLGVIAPTAALSSMPYTPEESMDALKFFYYTIGDKTWGPYGFYDAFNTSAGWYGTSDLAIDEGPIIVMIENYRTGLLWDLFMSAPEVTVGMDKLGFTN